MTKRPRRSMILVAALVVIAASIAVTAAMAASNSHALKFHSSTSARLSSTFSVLRRSKASARSAAAAEVLPAAAVNALGQMPGLSPSAAVFAGGTYATWVVPGSTEVCLINGPTRPGSASGGGGVCGSIAGAEARGLAVTTESASGAPVVIGLAPNGNSSVTVTNTNGTTESVPVENNVYEITSGTPDTVTLNDASGEATTRHVAILSQPPSSAPAGTAAP